MIVLILYVHWDERIPYSNDLVHASSDQRVMLGAVVNSGYALWNTKYPLVTGSLWKKNLQLLHVNSCIAIIYM